KPLKGGKKRLDILRRSLVVRKKRGSLMICNRVSLILVASVGWFVLSGPASNCFALPVDLGTAGSQYWTVLQVGNGTVTLTQPVTTTKKKSSTKKKGTAVTSTVPQVAIKGNVGVGESGQILDSGEQFNGDLYLGDNTSAQFSGTYANNSPVSGA